MASILVVGAGLSGLACAWKLRRAGHEVEVLERRAGNLGTRLDPEASRICGGDLDLLAAAAALGIGQVAGPSDSEAVLRAGRFEGLPRSTFSGLLQEPGGSRLRRLRWLRGPPALARRARGRLAALAPHDGAAFPAVLFRELGDDPLVARLAAMASFDLGVAPGAVSNAAGLACLARRAEGERPVFLEGGVSGLRRALARPLRQRRSCEVVSVETESAGARLRYRTQGRMRSVLADAAVVALPASEVLLACPKLSPEERGFFEQVEAAACLQVELRLAAPPLRFPWHRVGFPETGTPLASLTALHREPGAAPRGEGLLFATLTPEASRSLEAIDDPEVAEAVLAALAETPVGRLFPLDVSVERTAPTGPLFAPGAVERIVRFERRIERTPRIGFAGGHLTGPGPGAAVTSGLRAATEVARSL